jgi:phage gp46-like protein
MSMRFMLTGVPIPARWKPVTTCKLQSSSVCSQIALPAGTTLMTVVIAAAGGDSDADTQLGSRLWLLRREKLTTNVAIRAEEYAKEALDWLKGDGVVSDISCTTQIVMPNRLNLIIRYLPPDGDWQESAFFWIWEQINNAV